MAGSGLAFVELGTSPAWLEDGDFGDEFLDGYMFFTSNVQLGVHFGYQHELMLTIRIHPISNGGLTPTNLGTDRMSIEISDTLAR